MTDLRARITELLLADFTAEADARLFAQQKTKKPGGELQQVHRIRRGPHRIRHRQLNRDLLILPPGTAPRPPTPRHRAPSHRDKRAPSRAALPPAPLASVHQAAGTGAIREEQPFERYFRDAHTMTQHAFVSASRFESVGKLMFGLETDWPFFAM